MKIYSVKDNLPPGDYKYSRKGWAGWRDVTVFMIDDLKVVGYRDDTYFSSWDNLPWDAMFMEVDKPDEPDEPEYPERKDEPEWLTMINKGLALGKDIATVLYEVAEHYSTMEMIRYLSKHLSYDLSMNEGGLQPGEERWKGSGIDLIAFVDEGSK